MSFERIKESFLHLPKHTKLIGIGSFILAISTVLPWYADLDSYRIGDQFLGVTGPASFVGIVVLALSVFSFGLFSYRVFDRHVPRLPVREGIIHLFVAIESLFLLVIVNSIYFHPKFGVNITLKESGFGMTIAFIGAIVLLLGGYMQNRKEISKDTDIGKLEPLIKMEEKVATVSSATVDTNLPRQHVPVEPRKVVSKMQQKEMPRPFLFGERGVFAAQQQQARAEQQKPIESVPAATPDVKKEDKTQGSYMLRMDL
jgi:hypothetical protein